MSPPPRILAYRLLPISPSPPLPSPSIHPPPFHSILLPMKMMISSSLFLLLQFLSFAQIEGAKLAKPSKSTTQRPTFGELDLLKRPLNYYIIANGKHAAILNKTSNSGADNSSTSIEYRIARPPFLIKTRGSAILLNAGNSLDWHFGYPSLLQMLAASGHATLALEGGNASKLVEAIGWEELHGLILIGAGEGGAELALNAIEKESRIRDQLDGVVLVNSPEANLERIEREMKKGFGKSRPFWVLLNGGGGNGNALKIGDYLGGEGILKALGMEWEPEEKENAQKLAQILVNFLDFVHPR